VTLEQAKELRKESEGMAVGLGGAIEGQQPQEQQQEKPQSSPDEEAASTITTANGTSEVNLESTSGVMNESETVSRVELVAAEHVIESKATSETDSSTTTANLGEKEIDTSSERALGSMEVKLVADPLIPLSLHDGELIGNEKSAVQDIGNAKPVETEEGIFGDPVLNDPLSSSAIPSSIDSQHLEEKSVEKPVEMLSDSDLLESKKGAQQDFDNFFSAASSTKTPTKTESASNSNRFSFDDDIFAEKKTTAAVKSTLGEDFFSTASVQSPAQGKKKRQTVVRDFSSDEDDFFTKASTTPSSAKTPQSRATTFDDDFFS
jgi:hypothetical protein